MKFHYEPSRRFILESCARNPFATARRRSLSDEMPRTISSPFGRKAIEIAPT
jgi:hypothetical protein